MLAMPSACRLAVSPSPYLPGRPGVICRDRASRAAGREDRRVSEWAFSMHPPLDDFIATMTGAERSAFDAHAPAG
jgi:hypothetical protein